MRNLWWKIWLGTAAAITTAYFVVPNTPQSKLVLYNGVGLLAVCALLFGMWLNKTKPKPPWLFLAGGLTSFLVADVIYYLLELSNGDAGPPFPNIADFFYLMMYPLVMIGLTLMVRAVSPGRDKASFIDAAVVGIAMFGALYVLFVDSSFEGDNSLLTMIVILAYPVMDVFLLAVAARLIVTVHLKHPPFAFMVLAIASLAIADVAYNIALTTDSFKTGTWIDAFWLAFYALMATAALHPSAGTTPEYVDSEGKVTARQLVIMFVATLSVPLVDLFWGVPADRVVTTIASALLFLFILVRVYGLTQELQRGKDRLRHAAEHDALTGLSNRSLFADRTRAALKQVEEGHVAVLFIDLDDFKNVNDSMGHPTGDALLAEVSSRIEGCVGPSDTVARFGGDEFAVLLPGATDRRSAVTVARRVLDSLADPIELEDCVLHASASIGIAMDLDADTNVESLLRNADVAMYLSKSRGKGRYEFFENEMHEEVVERLDLKADLRQAIELDQFVLHYQPIFDLDTGNVALVEALVRWQHPERGLVMPDRFIPLAEETGLIVDIGAWVLRKACIQASQWRKLEGNEDLGITVNLSMRQLEDGTKLVGSLTQALRESGLKAEHLVLEITESMLALDHERSAGILEQIKTIGVKMAIDDFGTGYSSMAYLRSFPVDSIKIDRSFISELNRSSTSTALIEAIVNLSQALGAYTVAEGIEYSDQADTLRQLGCDRGQGFYYCRPLDAAALSALFKDRKSDHIDALEAWRRSSETVQERVYDITVRNGMKEIRSVAADIAEIHADIGTPLMGNFAWLSNWAEAFTNWEPFMVEVRSAQTRQLVACALLARSQRAEGSAVVAMGHGSSLYTSLPARDDEAARALARAVADAVEDLPGAWSLDLEQIEEYDPTLRALTEELDQAQLLPELRVPHVVFSTAHTVDDVLSTSMAKQIRRAQRKIEKAGMQLTMGFDRGRAITPSLLDEVETIHIKRDRDQRRRSDLDRPAQREFWRRVVEGGNNEWEVEIASLRLDGELAAYVVALLDGDTYRVYDGRMNSKFKEFSPGRLMESAALSRAITDPRFAVLDWMSGVAAEKLLITNYAEARKRLVATSGSSYLATTATLIPKRVGRSADASTSKSSVSKRKKSAGVDIIDVPTIGED